MDFEEDEIFSLKETDGLPDELLKELKILKRDDFEKKIIDLFKKAKGELNLDQIQVAYYRLYDEVKERRQITTKLYNMAKSEKPAIDTIKGKKGVYKLREEFRE